MKVCGVEIKGNEAILAVAEANAQSMKHLTLEIKKIRLVDNDDAAYVKSFNRLIKSFVIDNHIDQVAIKKRNKTGKFSGGSTSFKIEAIIQLLDDCRVSLLHHQKITAANKKHNFDLPNSLNNYQHEAFLTACAAVAELQE